MARSCGLLDHRGILLGDLIHRIHRGGDLVEAHGLFASPGGDLRDHAVHIAHLFQDAPEGLSGFRDEMHAVVDLLGRGGDESLDLARRFGGPLRECPHFRGHHGKSTTGFACASGFDAGVQGKQVGLEGDLVDDPDDAGNLRG